MSEENSGTVKEMSLPRKVICDAHEENANLMFGVLSLALQTAIQNKVPFSINADNSLYDEILRKTMQDFRDAALDPDNEIPDIAANASHIDDYDICSASGVVLVVGAGSKKIQLLKAHHEATLFITPHSDADLAVLVDAFPEAGRAKLRSNPPAPTLSASQLEGLGWFDERYDIVASGTLNPHAEYVELGKDEPRVCRYCFRSEPEVTFEELAHAFPEQTGNKKLVDLRECDCCNKRFGKTIDDDFSKWSLPIRTLGRVIGKKSVPTFKATDQKVRVEYENGDLQISAPMDDQRVNLDHENKRLTMTLDRQPYTPMGVFKCLVKMALAVMPESEAGQCRHLKKWILEKDHSFESFPFRPLMLFTQSLSGPLPNDIFTFHLLRRKPGAEGVQYFIFVLSFSNYIYQIGLPMPEMDCPTGEAKYEMRYFPHPWDTPQHIEEFGRPRLSQEDLSSPEKRRGDTYTASMSFSDSQEVDLTSKN